MRLSEKISDRAVVLIAGICFLQLIPVAFARKILAVRAAKGPRDHSHHKQYPSLLERVRGSLAMPPISL
jgi:hypothetical protein